MNMDAPVPGYVEIRRFEPRRDALVSAHRSPSRFKIERWGEITFAIDEEFLIDGILPKQGVGLLYGASQSFKSFVATHMGLCAARAEPWAGRQTEGTPVVYLAAEGAAGLRKRRQGYVEAGLAPSDGVDFALMSAAPNLGTAAGDYELLVATIEAASIKPKLIIIDTVAKVIGGADENGGGMAQFLVNAEALAQHFGCFVLAVHHTGWNDDAKDRPRGWSGLPAALDVQILSERRPGEMFATLTVQKLKDEPAGLQLNAQMARVVLGVSKTGREVSTLIVETVTEMALQMRAASNRNRPAIPKALKLLLGTVAESIGDRGEDIGAFGGGGVKVRAVAERYVRDPILLESPNRPNPTRTNTNSMTVSGRGSSVPYNLRSTRNFSWLTLSETSASFGRHKKGRAGTFVVRRPLSSDTGLPGHS